MHKYEKLLDLLQIHFNLYQEISVQDIYKLLYQGTMGPRHMLQHVDKAHAYLLKEWQEVPENTDKPLLVPVSTDHTVVRINFQTAKANGITAESIWEMKYQTALHFVEKKKNFKSLWWKTMELAQNQKISYTLDQFHELDQNAWEGNYPAMHHSESYRMANYPAYRIIFVSEFEKHYPNL